MPTKIKFSAIALAAVMLFSSIICLTGCGKTGTAKTYTLNDSIVETPKAWNPHTAKTDADRYITNYTNIGFVDVSIDEDGISYTWVYEMADSIDDITAGFNDREKWNITEDAGRVYKITLNSDAVWSNGDKINADSYIYSLKQLLDPKMQNYRASAYCIGNTAILNADKYFQSETPVYTPVVPAYKNGDAPDYSYDIENNTVYMHLTSKSMSLTDKYSVYDLLDMGYIKVEDYSILADNQNAFGYVEINDTTREAAKKVAAQFLAPFGMTYSDEMFKKMLFCDTGAFTDSYDFSNVGLCKSGEYELIYITAQPVDMFSFLTAMTSTWLVHEGLYESGKTTTGDLVTTNYGTSVDTFLSYGPYKLVIFEKDKQIIMERNDAWYGYSDGKHKNQYMTTTIKCDIIADHSTAIRLFRQGKLDGVSLTAYDMDTYRMSDYLLKTDTPYTFRYIFATDINKLAALETGKDDNKKILAYDDFRKAISLSIDRTTLVQKATPGYKPAYALFNSLYFCDAANNPSSVYRSTVSGKEAVLDLYGIAYGAGKEYADIDTAYAAVTGYDAGQAKKLFQSVYEQAKMDGNYIDGQMITINCMVSPADTLTPDEQMQETLLNQFLKAAAEGTGFMDKISVKFHCGAADRYKDVADGKIEMILGAWDADIFNPFSAIRCYTDADYMDGLAMINESCGWNPSAETLELTVDIDGDGKPESVTHTLKDWAQLINGGICEEAGSQASSAIQDPDIKLTVLAALENAVLASYQCIPFASETYCQLYSQQIRYFTLDYNIMYGYGGIRLLTYNYDDAEWDAYVAAQGGTLRYE